jgi:hypothetical protein
VRNGKREVSLPSGNQSLNGSETSEESMKREVARYCATFVTATPRATFIARLRHDLVRKLATQRKAVGEHFD